MLLWKSNAEDWKVLCGWRLGRGVALGLLASPYSNCFAFLSQKRKGRKGGREEGKEKKRKERKKEKKEREAK